MKLSEALKMLPKSDEKLAEQIGISSKTIKRMKSWESFWSARIRDKIKNYLTKLSCILDKIDYT